MKKPAPTKFDFNQFGLPSSVNVKKAEYVNGKGPQNPPVLQPDLFDFGPQPSKEGTNIVKKFDDLLNLGQTVEQPSQKTQCKTEEFNFDFGPAEGTKVTENKAKTLDLFTNDYQLKQDIFAFDFSETKEKQSNLNVDLLVGQEKKPENP